MDHNQLKFQSTEYKKSQTGIISPRVVPLCQGGTLKTHKILSFFKRQGLEPRDIRFHIPVLDVLRHESLKV
jgi:hypothetical protein